MMENHSFDNIARYWDFHPDIDNLRNIAHCNNYTNPYYTIYGMPLSICAGPYEKEVPLHDPDHNFAGASFELYETCNPTKVEVPTMGDLCSASQTNIILRLETLPLSLRHTPRRKPTP